MKKFLKSLVKMFCKECNYEECYDIRMATAENIRYWMLKTYKDGKVVEHRYYGDDVETAAIRFAKRHGCDTARVYAINYYGATIDEYFINA